MQWRGHYTVESHVRAIDYRVKMRANTNTYHINKLKKYISREPDIEGYVGPVDRKDGATTALAGVIHQDVDLNLTEVLDLKGDRQIERTQDIKPGGELPDDLRRVLRDLLQKYPGIFIDMSSP